MSNAHTLLLAALVGLSSGAHASIWGMYKDAIHEGFSAPRFARSVVLGSLAAVVLQSVFSLPLPEPGAMLVLFGLAYAAERGVVETWKTFFRDEDQAKYFIPMQFQIGGRRVSRPLRALAGLGYASVIGLGLLVIARLNDGPLGPPTTVRVALVGLAVGLLVGIGGAWKDAPKEGFDLLKFFRSPAMTVGFALLLGRFTADYLLIAVAAIGYERAAAETYKTFCFPSRPRGKFAGMPEHFPEMRRHRRYFVPAYVAICTGVLVLATLAMQTTSVAYARGWP